MATKNLFLHLKDNVIFNDRSNGQHNNINLNQNRQCSSSNTFSELSKSVLTQKKEVLDSEFSFITTFSLDKLKKNSSPKNIIDYANNIEAKNHCLKWNKATKYLPSNYLQNNKDAGKEYGTKNYNTKNSSTFSLHIYAYENLIEANLFNSTKEPSKQNDLVKKQENAKQIIAGVISVIQNLFEFLRQERTEKPNTPEVAQYKASQKLLDPKQTPSLQNSNRPYVFKR